MAKSHAISADGLEYTFVLSDAMWHDGTPVTAADVAFTYNTGLKAAAGSNITSLISPISGLAGRRSTTTPRTRPGSRSSTTRRIKFVLDQPNAQILPTTVRGRLDRAEAPVRWACARGVRHAGHRDEPVHRLRPVQDDGVQRASSSSTSRRSTRYVNGSGFAGLPSGRQGLDPDLRGRERAADVHAGRRGRLPVLPPTVSGDQLKQLQAIQGMSAQKSLVGFNIFYSFNLLDPGSEQILDREFRQATVWALDRHTLVERRAGRRLQGAGHHESLDRPVGEQRGPGDVPPAGHREGQGAAGRSGLGSAADVVNVSGTTRPSWTRTSRSSRRCGRPSASKPS